MPRIITREQLKRRLTSPSTPVLLEALPEKYYADGHLPGALHMPHDRIEELAPTVLPDKETEIVVYCASTTCQNSHIAARALEGLGYVDVSVYADGKKDWAEAGLPMESDAAAA